MQNGKGQMDGGTLANLLHREPPSSTLDTRPPVVKQCALGCDSFFKEPTQSFAVYGSSQCDESHIACIIAC